jgi:hypothetical protein
LLELEKESELLLNQIIEEWEGMILTRIRE